MKSSMSNLEAPVPPACAEDTSFIVKKVIIDWQP